MKSPIASVLILGAYGALLPIAAEAHTFGAHGAGLAEGFAHPFLGLDHLLAMLAIGIWAAQLGGAARWLAPLTFMGVMALSALLGLGGFVLPMLEPAIASSVFVLGLLVAFAVQPTGPISLALVGLFALFHGNAHGLELPETASAWQYGAGFLLATLFLNASGFVVGNLLRRHSVAARLSGSMIALTGLFLLATAA
jgi:urease accessory protein